MPTKEELFELHVLKNIKIDDIATMYKVSRSTISRWFKKLGIPSKHSGMDSYEKAIGTNIPELDNYDFMFNLYVKDGKSIQDISDQFKKNYYFIRKKLLNLNIPIRKSNKTRWEKVKRNYENSNLDQATLYDLFINKEFSKEYIAKEYGLSKNEVARRLSQYKIYKTLRKSKSFLNSMPDSLRAKDDLVKLYITEEKSVSQISKEFGISAYYVKKALKYFDIPLRNQKESAKILCGEKSPHWKGVSYSLYDKIRAYSRDNLHKIVKERDKNTCQFCGSKDNLQVHHIKPLWKIYYEILNEHPEYDRYKNINELREIIINDKRINDLTNLITCCEECHLFKLHGYTHKEVETLKKRARIKYFR